MGRRGKFSVIGRAFGFQFRRPRLFVGCLAACVLLQLGVVAFVWYRGKCQEARVNMLLAFDVSIEAQYGPFQYEPPPGAGKPTVPGQLSLILGRGQRILGFQAIDEPPTGCEWIIRLMGEHCFASVTDIALFDERFSDADVPLLLAFRDVKVINVSDTAITDKGLAQLATLKHLVRLDVSGTKVTAKSLRLLANCRELKELDICDTDADEKTIDYLKEALPGCWIR